MGQPCAHQVQPARVLTDDWPRRYPSGQGVLITRERPIMVNLQSDPTPKFARGLPLRQNIGSTLCFGIAPGGFQRTWGTGCRTWGHMSWAHHPHHDPPPIQIRGLATLGGRLGSGPQMLSHFIFDHIKEPQPLKNISLWTPKFEPHPNSQPLGQGRRT